MRRMWGWGWGCLMEGDRFLTVHMGVDDLWGTKHSHFCCSRSPTPTLTYICKIVPLKFDSKMTRFQQAVFRLFENEDALIAEKSFSFASYWFFPISALIFSGGRITTTVLPKIIHSVVRLKFHKFRVLEEAIRHPAIERYGWYLVHQSSL